MHYVFTDYLGSLRCITSTTSAIEQRLCYDAWGRRRNPSNWTYNNLPVHSLFSRGYTSHEHLDAFNLINMNGRVYDPLLGRFLSPDNVVQSPFNTQSYNRYSYCINNPLTYKDPSGNYFLIDDFVLGFFKGLVSGRNPLKEGWNQAADCAKIYGGLFAADTKQPGWGWQILSRFTWQLPQTVLGLIFAQTANTFGNIERVDFKAGATVLKSRYDNLFYGLGGQGITMGSYIIGSNQIEANPNNWLFQHEYGHYLQSRASGWAYLQRYAIPSLFSRGDYDPSNIFDPHYPDYNPVEQDANARSIQYFHNREGNDFIWNFDYNPIGYPGRGWHRNLDQFDTPEFQSLLQRLTIRPNFGDYYSWVLPIIGPIIDGLVNTQNYNQRYINSE